MMDSSTNADNNSPTPASLSPSRSWSRSPSPSLSSSASSNGETSQTRTATLRNSYSSNDIEHIDSEIESPQRMKSIDLPFAQDFERTTRRADVFAFRKCQSVVYLTSKEASSIANSKHRHTIHLPLVESKLKLSQSTQNTILLAIIKREKSPCARLKRCLDSCKVIPINNVCSLIAFLLCLRSIFPLHLRVIRLKSELHTNNTKQWISYITF